MQLDQFWKIIDDARTAVVESADEPGDYLVQIEDTLLDLDPSEVASFHTHLMQQFYRTFHWDIVAAAAIIFGEKCDRLDIDGFRAWIVSRGESFLNKTLEDVDSLGELGLLPDDLYYYGLLSIAEDVHEQLGGDELPAEATPAAQEEPAGKEFQVKDLAQRLPKLADDFAFFVPGEDQVELETPSDDASFDSLLADVTDDENPYADN